MRTRRAAASYLAVGFEGTSVLPALDRLLAAGVGGVVLLTITADETDYSVAPGTVINGIPESSDNVVFSELGSGLYALSYTVSEGDQNVAVGNLQATVVMQDEAGNVSEPFSIVDQNELEVYTELPAPIMSGV